MMKKRRYEGILTIKDFEDNPSLFIYIRSGYMVCESIFKKRFNGNLRLLLDCIEDNVIINKEGEDEIDYNNAIRDYFDLM